MRTAIGTPKNAKPLQLSDPRHHMIGGVIVGDIVNCSKVLHLRSKALLQGVISHAKTIGLREGFDKLKVRWRPHKADAVFYHLCLAVLFSYDPPPEADQVVNISCTHRKRCRSIVRPHTSNAADIPPVSVVSKHIGLNKLTEPLPDTHKQFRLLGPWGLCEIAPV